MRHPPGVDVSHLRRDRAGLHCQECDRPAKELGWDAERRRCLCPGCLAKKPPAVRQLELVEASP